MDAARSAPLLDVAVRVDNADAVLLRDAGKWRESHGEQPGYLSTTT
jgi:hypothetical protein